MPKTLYGYRWRKRRTQYLAQHPLCVMCAEDGNVRPATELDHILKHDGDLTLFWDEDNWQGLCADHHRSTKARLERSGKVTGCDLQGNPIHELKHW